jgi:phenylalanine-4-hydroxylase
MRADISYNNIIDGDEFERAQAAADAAGDPNCGDIDTSTLYVTQLYERYSEENHRVWKTLWERRREVLEAQASNTYLKGLDAINLVPDRVPLLFGEVDDPYEPGRKIVGINEYLKEITGWQSHGVPGYLPAKAFFTCLSQREFPSTIVVRPEDKMDYLPEPDIFHDVFGHVPLHADPVFADFLQTYGKAALVAGPEHTESLARLFWFTVEFGLISEDGRLKVYGSGTISSHSESEYALAAPEGTGGYKNGEIERRPFDLERVINTPFEIDHFQDIVYVLDSFEQLRDAMNSYAERVISESSAATA